MMAQLDQGSVDMEGANGDILAMINIGGDDGVTTHGWWEELHRTVKVK